MRHAADLPEPLEADCCVHPEAVARARSALPSSTALERGVALLRAGADPTRLKMLAALTQGELCVGDLSSVVGQSESAVSHQLRLLREGKLVAARREGRVIYYRLDDDHVLELLRAALAHAGEGE